MSPSATRSQKRPFQFSIRALLFATFVVAVCLAFVPFAAILDWLRYTPEQKLFRENLLRFQEVVAEEKALRAARVTESPANTNSPDGDSPQP